MLVSESRKPIVAPQKIMSDTRIRETANKDILILDSPIFPSITIVKGETPLKIYRRLSSLKMFSINFSYLQQLYHTKVLKVTYRDKQSLYKVALNGSISNSVPICWLKHQPGGWSMLFGHELKEGLKRAITTAIEYQEELA
jgi:hypothetical protein